MTEVYPSGVECIRPPIESRSTGYGNRVLRRPHTPQEEEMSPSDDRAQEPWTDPQTHLDTDPVNAEPSPAQPTPAQDDEEDES